MTRRRALVALLAALTLVGLTATVAQAHAVLERSDPADGATLDAAPTEIRLEFNEPVSPPVGAVRVFDPAGERADLGRTESEGDGSVVVAPLDDGIGEGTHVVTWRAVSADGHPVKGAFVFHVGEAGTGVEDSVMASLLGSGSDLPFGIASGLARWITYAASLLAIGGFVLMTLSRRVSTTGTGRGVTTLVRIACLAGAVASLLQIPLFAAETTGLGFSALSSGGAWGDAVSGSVGIAALVRVAGFGAVFLGVTIPVAIAGWLGGGVLIAAELITGHTRTTDPAWVAVAADAVHVGAAGVWFGGLAALTVGVLRHRGNDDVVSAASTVGLFSSLAAWSVLALTVAGTALAWTQVRALHAATSTTYGWTLIAKLAVVALVFLVALYNNRRLVPAITRAPADPDPGEEDTGPRTAWRRLGRTVGIEIAGVVLALGATAMLVNLQPAAEAAGVSGVYSTFVDFGEGELNLVVDPNRAGPNEIHVYVLTAAGLPADTEGEMSFEMSLPEQDIGPLVRRPQVAGPGHFLHTGPELALPGTWEITVRQRVSEFEEEVTVVPVVVND